jgi:hypothetical protein
MSKKDILQRLKSLSDQLKLIHLYKDEFLKIEGRRGVENRIDSILDEMNELNKKLKEWS